MHGSYLLKEAMKSDFINIFTKALNIGKDDYREIPDLSRVRE